MITAGAVLVCALTALGRPEESFPPIVFVDQPAAGTPQGTEAFVVIGRPTIYLVTSSQAFRTAQVDGCQNDRAVKKVASMLVHEEWHVQHGADEEGAYLAQLRALVMLDFGPSTAVYQDVRRAMVSAKRANRPGRGDWLADAAHGRTPPLTALRTGR